MDLKIRKLIPDFFGVETIGLSKNVAMSGDYLVLQDITDGFLEPNIMDVKMGAKTYGPDASKTKMMHEDSKYVGTKGENYREVGLTRLRKRTIIQWKLD